MGSRETSQKVVPVVQGDENGDLGKGSSRDNGESTSGYGLNRTQ